MKLQFFVFELGDGDWPTTPTTIYQLPHKMGPVQFFFFREI